MIRSYMRTITPINHVRKRRAANKRMHILPTPRVHIKAKQVYGRDK